MALPASGQISSGDIRSELSLSSVSSFSFAEAAYKSYVPLNSESTSLPPSSGQIDMSDWYSYCHTCSVSCSDTTVYSGEANEYIIIDLGTTTGVVSYSGSTVNPGCLILGTKIVTENQSIKNIEELQIGDKVYNGEVYNQIVGTSRFTANKIYKFNDGILTSSESHNHYVLNFQNEIEIKTSDKVLVGEKFLSSDRQIIGIEKIEILEGSFDVINIELDGDQLYIANNIITHNKCGNPQSRLFLGYPYNSSGTLVGTAIVSNNTTTFSGTYNFTYTTERYLYFVPACPFGTNYIQVSCPTIEVYWSFSMGADSGDMEITVNGSQVVYETSTNSGYFNVSWGDTIVVSTFSQMGYGFTLADSTTSVVEDTVTVCSDSQSGNPSASSGCNYTVAGFSIEIYGTASQV